MMIMAVKSIMTTTTITIIKGHSLIIIKGHSLRNATNLQPAA